MRVTLRFIGVGTSATDDKGLPTSRNDVATLPVPAEAGRGRRCVQLALGVAGACPSPRPGLIASDAPAAPPAS